MFRKLSAGLSKYLWSRVHVVTWTIYDLTDVDRYCLIRDDKTVRLGFKPKLGVLQ